MTNASAHLLMDRFVSASTSADSEESLRGLLDNLDRNIAHALLESPDTCRALCGLISSSTGVSGDSASSISEGATLACQVYQKVLNDPSLHEKALCVPEKGSFVNALLDRLTLMDQSYARVLALELLQSLCTSSTKQMQLQLLEVPNGISRIVDLLQEEQVRNEALLLTMQLAKWPTCARILLFEETCNHAIAIAMSEGGLTGGNLVVKDCLILIKELIQNDPMGADLLVQSPSCLNGFSSLLDLRQGNAYKNPAPVLLANHEKDDLDDILKGSTSETPTVVPKLSQREEDLITLVLEIMGIVMETQRGAIWMHRSLTGLSIELALLSLPVDSPSFPCAVPSMALQMKALGLLSKCFNSEDLMLPRIDGLLYLVCAGGSEGSRCISSAALHILRQTLTKDTASLWVLHTLAPPIEAEGETPVTVVQKLLNTLHENLEQSDAPPERRRINIMGAAGALGVFFTNGAGETTREMLLRIRPTLIGAILTFLEETKERDLMIVLIRLLCEWIPNSPEVVAALLSNIQSTTCFGMLFSSKDEAVSAMTGLLLGLIMEYVGEEECGGWSRETVMDLIQKRGTSNYTKSLEDLKIHKDLPFAACDLENKHFVAWCTESVHIVRKRLVQELTSEVQTDDEDDAEETPGASRAAIKSLNKMLAQQTQELEELRTSLNEAQGMVESQKELLRGYKQRIESTPTQLDDMLTSTTNERDELAKRVKSLESDLVHNKSEYTRSLKDKDDNLKEIETQLQESQEREKEARDEATALQEEMEGLSRAYASLEEEFNRRGASTASEATSGEDRTPPGQQPQGEDSHQRSQPSSDTQSDDLRAEIARLRQDAVAADQWMTMAVQRMEELGNQNSSLQQQLASSQQSTSSVMSGEQSNLFQQEQQRAHDLETQVHQLQNEISSLLATHETRREEWESQLSSTQHELEEARTRVHFLEEVKGQLEAQNKAVHDEDATATIANLRAERDSILAQKEEESKANHSTIEKMSKAHHEQSIAKEAELSVLKESLESVQNKVLSQRAEMEKQVRAKEENIEQRDQSIRELETQLSKQPPTIDPESSKEELEKLREANDAAQQWMAQAVEHHQMLQARITELEEREGSPSGSNSAAGSGPVHNGVEAMDELRSSLADRTWERDEARKELDSLRLELNQKMTELKESEARRAETQRTVDELQQLKEQLADRERKLKWLQDEVDEAKLELAGHERTAEELDTANSEVQKLYIELEEAKSELDKLKKSGSSNEQLQQEVQELLEKTKVKSDESMRHQESSNRLKEELETLRTENESVSSERDAYLVTIDDLRAKLTEFNAWTATAQTRISELEVEKNTVESNMAKALESEQKLKEQVSNLRSEVETLTSRLEVAMETKTATQGERDQLTDQIRAHQEKIADITTDLESAKNAAETAQSDSKKAAEKLDLMKVANETLRVENENHSATIMTLKDNIKALENHADDLRMKNETVKEMAIHLSEKDRHVTIAEERAAVLEQELDDLKDQSTGVISSWKERVEEVQESKRELEAQIALQEENASEAISQWEERCNMLDERRILLEQELEVAGSNQAADVGQSQELQDLKVSNASLREEIRQKSETLDRTLDELSSEKNLTSELEAQIASEQESATAAIAKWEERCDLLDKSKEAVVEALETEKKALIEEKERVESLEGDLEENRQEATEAISRWEERCSAMEEQNNLLERQLDESRSTGERDSSGLRELRDQAIRMRSAMEEQTKTLAAASEEISREKSLLLNEQHLSNDLKAQIAGHERHMGEVVSQWEERCNILEQELESARTDQQTQQNNATESISRWEERCSELKHELDVARKMQQEQQESAGEAVTKWEGRCSALEEDLETARRDQLEQQVNATEAISRWEERCSLLEQELEIARKEQQEQIENATEVVSQWEERCFALEQELETARRDRQQQVEDAEGAIARWENRCTALEEELEANRSKLSAEDRVSAELEELKASLSSMDNELSESRASLASTVAELEKERETGKSLIQNLEDRIKEEQNKATEATSQSEERENILKEQLMHAEQELALAMKDRCSAEETLVEFKTLRERFTSLQNELATKSEALAFAQEDIRREQEATISAEKLRSDAEKVLTDKQEELYRILDERAEKEECHRTELELRATACKAAEESVASLKLDLARAEKESKEAIMLWKERNGELEALVSELEGTIDEHDAAATEAIGQWEIRYNEMAERLAEAEVLAKKSDVIAALEAEKKEVVGQRDTLAKELEEAKVHFAETTASYESLMSEYSEHISSVQKENDQLTKSLSSAKESEHNVEVRTTILQQQLHSVSQERDLLVEELERAKLGLKEIHGTLQARDDAISELEMKQKESSEKIESLKEALARESETRVELEKKYAKEHGSLTETESALDETRKKADALLTEARARSSLELKKSNARVNELEELLARERTECKKSQDLLDVEMQARKTAEASLVEKEKQNKKETADLRGHLETLLASELKAKFEMEEAFTSTKRAKEALDKEFLREEQARKAAQTATVELEKRLVETESSLKSQLDHLVELEKKAKREMENALKVERNRYAELEKASQFESSIAQQKDQEWNTERELLVHKNAALTQKLSDMENVVVQLQDELQEAEESIQAKLTDEIGEKASVMAVEALRGELNEMRMQSQDNMKLLETERSAREEAEMELERLKADFGLLVRAGHISGHLEGDLLNLAMKAEDELHQLEHRELEDLKSALERAMLELEASREREEAADKKSAQARLQLSVSEQEMTQVKSDLNFMTNAMEELRESEVSTRTSLEYRISALEDDREVLARSHNDEMQAIKNELAQLNMEKERLLHALDVKDRENKALAYATTQSEADDNELSLQLENAKLRIEKAQLLAASTEYGWKTERRIREAVAAHASSVEADIILERELRSAAESSLDAMKAQIADLKKHHQTSAVSPANQHAQKDRELPTEEIEKELDQMTKEKNYLEKEVETLKAKLAEAKTVADSTVEELTKKCRATETRLREMERNGHYEAEVAAELARLRNDAKSNGGPLGSLERGNLELSNGHNVASSAPPDIVLQYKKAIQEERTMYRDLVEEHDKLLVLLAQQDVERTCLQEALEREVGQNAVDAALRHAEEYTVEQYRNSAVAT